MKTVIGSILILTLALGGAAGLLVLVRNHVRQETITRDERILGKRLAQALPGYRITSAATGGSRYREGVRRDGDREVRAQVFPVSAAGLDALVGVDEKGKIIGAVVWGRADASRPEPTLMGILGLRREEPPVRESLAAWIEAQCSTADLLRPAEAVTAVLTGPRPATGLTLGERVWLTLHTVSQAREVFNAAMIKEYGLLTRHLAATPAGGVRP